MTTVLSSDGMSKFILKTSKEDIKYDILYKNSYLIKNSRLGFDFDSGEFGSNIKVGKVINQKIDETYELVVGKVKQAHDYCTQTVILLKEKSEPRRVINLIIRAYNDGIAFRYEFPKQKTWNLYVMYDEKTQFQFKGNPKALFMYLPGYVSSHEALYNCINIEENSLIEMPATFEYSNGIYMSVTEAAIRDYAGMYLTKGDKVFEGKLSPKLGQEKITVAIEEFPHRTSWMVLITGVQIETLLETNILTSLNELCKIEDTSWIKSYRTMLTCWNGNMVPDTTLSPGNNFETNKYYIDFSARNRIDLHGTYGYAETP